MANPIHYRFRIKVGSNPYVDCKPIWGGGTSIRTEPERGEMFFRDKLSGKLLFMHTDFDAIHEAAFDTEFRVLIQKQVNGVWQSLNPAMRFWKTDCRFDYDRKTVEVEPESFDLYDVILGGLNKEFNLIELEPPTVPVTYRRQAIYQIYLPGADFLMNYSDGLWWETPVTPFFITPGPGETTTFDNHLAMLNDYGFGLGTGFDDPEDGQFNYARVVIPGTGDGLSPDVAGVYRCTFYQANGYANFKFRRLDGVYEIINDPSPPAGQTRQLIVRVSDSAIMYATDYNTNPWSPFGQPPHSSPNATFTSLSSPSSQVQGYLFLPYVRLLTEKTEVNAIPTVELPEDDPFNKGIFTHALPIDTLTFEYSDGHNTDATRWGKFHEDALHFPGQYFTKPASVETLMPLLAATWTGASAWFYLNDELRDLQNEAGETITVEHAYKISDVLNSLLEAIGSTVTHQDDPNFSDFLYAAGSNTIRGDRKVPVIVPKSNILIGEYDQPAAKAPIRLGEALQLLKIFHKAFWYVGDEKFIVEHYHFFHNGKSYGAANVGTDLTVLQDARTSRSWGYLTQQAHFEKQDIPERLEFGWMDNVSKPFEGYPIDVLSTFAQKGNIENNQITRFTSDIDYLHVAPSTIANDGFVFLECEETENGLVVPFVDITLGADETYRLQNGWASFFWAHDKYHRHGLPATSVKLNGDTITATSVVRAKTQEILIPEIEDFDPYELIKTGLGNGRIESVERTLVDGFRKIRVRLDTD